MFNHIFCHMRTQKIKKNVLDFCSDFFAKNVLSCFCMIKEALCSFWEEIQTPNFDICNINEVTIHFHNFFDKWISKIRSPENTEAREVAGLNKVSLFIQIIQS